jgi:[methyl-Co(III) methanol-specific corrinoid protein]:coenzyme M methyltransferase
MKTSSYNLVMSAMYNGRKGERPPVGNPTSIVCHDLMDTAGVSFPDAHLDANAMADLALAGHEVLGFDTVMPEYSVQQEAAALGCVVDWGNRDRMPDNKNFPYENFSDIKVPENILEKPSTQVVLDALSILRRHVGGKVAIVGKVMGPWTLSYHMAGTQNFLLQIGMGETEKVIKHQEITAQIEGPLILHVCGDCSDRLEYFAQSGVDAYHMEWQVDAKMAVEKVGTLMSLVGNVNNPQVLYQGTPEDVHKQVRYAVEAGINIIGPECAIPLSTPIENLRAIVEAAHEGY